MLNLIDLTTLNLVDETAVSGTGTDRLLDQIDLADLFTPQRTQAAAPAAALELDVDTGGWGLADLDRCPGLRLEHHRASDPLARMAGRAYLPI